MAQSLGDRIALIRQTPPLGTVREPMSLRDFAAHVQARTTMKVDKDKLSRIERGVQPLDVDEAEAIASVDPLKRGKAWLAWGDPPEVATQGVQQTRPHHGTSLPDLEAQERAAAKQTAAAKRKRGRG